MKALQMKTTSMFKLFGRNLVLSDELPQLVQSVDVLFLADMFENFRNICMNHYELDPSWYFFAPCLAWDAALKIKKVQLELLSNLDMLLIIESVIRGGIATISHRHAKANNEYGS